MDTIMLHNVIGHNIRANIPTSLIRMGDGEAEIMRAARGGRKNISLYNVHWLAKLGLIGTDLTVVAQGLLRAGSEATFLAPADKGLYFPLYDIYSYFPDRSSFVGIEYPQIWHTMGVIKNMLTTIPVLILHRDASTYAATLSRIYKTDSIFGIELGSWKDHAKIKLKINKIVAAHDIKLLLVSGGPAGKALIVDLAKITGKVVIDIGSKMDMYIRAPGDQICN